VSDNGPGLPAAADAIFEAFYTTKPSGTGLGLSIARSIVEAHSGTIHARNRQGGGAVFHVTLPCTMD
jgi:signal transduction histidine kinase